LWIKIDALPDALRPDRSGVLFSLEARSPEGENSGGACIVGRVVGRSRLSLRRSVAEAFAMFVREGSLPVWRVAGRRALRLHPKSDEGYPR
jgi:hypothetical protein